jgi:predicted Fe-S protein YdhL (DUF1289 family)
MIVKLEASKCPPGNDTKNQERNRRPKQKDRNRQEITTREPALKRVHNQLNSPAHDPSGGNEKPNPKQAAAPIYCRGLARLRSERAAWNAVQRHRRFPCLQQVNSLRRLLSCSEDCFRAAYLSQRAASSQSRSDLWNRCMSVDADPQGGNNGLA